MKKLADSASFGAIRKFDIHTGIDFHCKEGTSVFAMRAGTVRQEIFTGPRAGSAWWNETYALLVEDETGVTLYGEILPERKLDLRFNAEHPVSVKVGDCLGTVMRVLKKNKGAPTSMLHLERYTSNTKTSVVWNLRTPQPENLLDPTKEFSDQELAMLFEDATILSHLITKKVRTNE